MKIMIVYGSLEGQTEKIAHFMAEHLRTKQISATVANVDNISVATDLADYDLIIVGGSIHMGSYPRSFRKFIGQHRDALNSTASAFFTVCMAIHSQNSNERLDADKYSEKLLAETEWSPVLNSTFAGAVKYTRYNIVTRYIMKMIARREGSSTDTSQDHEYTDWLAVRKFVDEIIDRVEARELF